MLKKLFTLKNTNIKILFPFIGIIILSSFLLTITKNENDNFLNLLQPNSKARRLIKKYLFPYKFISEQQQELSDLYSTSYTFLADIELLDKENSIEIATHKKTKKLSDYKTIDKYKLIYGFYSGINNIFPGSGYIDFHKDNIVVLSSRGVLASKKNIEDTEENFLQIKNNINDFIGINQFKKNQWFSLKDIFIYGNKIFVSYTEEKNPDCWNTSIIYGDFNYENINFEKLFSPDECIHSIQNIDNEFNAHQSGGKIIYFDDNNILLSLGDYRSRHLAQDIKSVNGKIIKVNIDNGNYEIVSMGHRNPQGLYFDRDNNFILETEHGPQGGDEINLIEVHKIRENKMQNYGWAISSAGEHYGGKNSRNKRKYAKYPLHNSHIEHGFIEPLYSFVPSIGISEIVKIGKNKYVASSLKDESLYFFEINENKQITDLDRVEVFERVRDLIFKENKLYLFMENTASIGVINLN
tara:strand:- start:155 stop:1555 length:1401 start_codon:yes stop_codon:yes gene_type:complete